MIPLWGMSAGIMVMQNLMETEFTLIIVERRATIIWQSLAIPACENFENGIKIDSGGDDINVVGNMCEVNDPGGNVDIRNLGSNNQTLNNMGLVRTY